jgi:hypothetical protein
MKNQIVLTLLTFFLFSSFSWTVENKLSNTDVRKLMIQKSINAYPGNCPCPYNRASNGSRCGKRSAWSRPGGYAPLCYLKDISDTQVNRYRKKLH